MAEKPKFIGMRNTFGLCGSCAHGPQRAAWASPKVWGRKVMMSAISSDARTGPVVPAVVSVYVTGHYQIGEDPAVYLLRSFFGHFDAANLGDASALNDNA